MNRVINVCLFMQNREHIEDQIIFLQNWVDNNDYSLQFSTKFESNCINLVFDGASIDQVVFQRKENTKCIFLVVATEHLEFLPELHYNGLPWSKTFNSSIDPFTSKKRLADLAQMVLLSDGVLVLGDSPNPEVYEIAFPRKEIFTLNFPTIKVPERNQIVSTQYDFLFSANTENSRTEFRKLCLNRIRKQGFSVFENYGSDFQNYCEISTKTSAVLLIPKSENWYWSSPMRVFRAALINKNIVSVGLSKNLYHESITDKLLHQYSLDELSKIELPKNNAYLDYNDLTKSLKNIELNTKFIQFFN